MPDPPRPFVLDPRLSNVPADVLRRRRDSPVSVTSPVLEWSAIQLSQLTSPLGRPLYQREIDVLTPIYLTSLDLSRIRVVETRLLNAPTTLGNQIRITPGLSFLTEDNKPILVHECGHVRQFQNNGTSYITCSVYHNASGQISTGDRNVAYMNYQLRPGCSFAEFSAEEQATIIGDYYEITVRYAGVANPPEWVQRRSPDLPIYESLMRQVRAGTPRSDRQIYQDSLMNVPTGPRAMDFNVPGGRDQEFAPVMPLLQIRFGRTR